MDLKDNKISVFSSFYDHDVGYSLCNVVEDQLRMFCDNGYKIKLFVDQVFRNPGGYWAHPNITYAFLPPVQRSNEGQLNDKWKEEIDSVYQCLKKELEGYKVVLTHDVILQPAELIYNVACRRLAKEREDLRWLNWCHSPTQAYINCNIPEIQELIGGKFPNSFICYPNDWDRKRVAINHKLELDEVKCVHHPSDFVSLLCGDEVDIVGTLANDMYVSRFAQDPRPEIYKLDKEINGALRLTKDFVKEFDLWNADVISVYPCRLDRGKQPEFNIKTMAKIKETGRKVLMVIFDFHSTGGDKVVYREELKQIARKWGLTEKECVFISEWKPETNYNVPRQFILNLKKFSDFHMHSSNTETYSLVVQESIATKNFIVLNHHLPVMRDIYGSENILYEPFGSTVDSLTGENGSTTLNIFDEKLEFENRAKRILYWVESNPVLAEWRFIRQKRNLDYIFKRELEPLLFV